MLKIKDSVELSELEKFGFERSKSCEAYYKDILSNTLHKGYSIVVYIYTKTRKIEIEFDTDILIITDVPVDLIFDLIQAGLVEKVEQ